jgi:hypothetical protein
MRLVQQQRLFVKFARAGFFGPANRVHVDQEVCACLCQQRAVRASAQ